MPLSVRRVWAGAHVAARAAGPPGSRSFNGECGADPESGSGSDARARVRPGAPRPAAATVTAGACHCQWMLRLPLRQC